MLLKSTKAWSKNGHQNQETCRSVRIFWPKQRWVSKAWLKGFLYFGLHTNSCLPSCLPMPNISPMLSTLIWCTSVCFQFGMLFMSCLGTHCTYHVSVFYNDNWLWGCSCLFALCCILFLLPSNLTYLRPWSSLAELVISESFQATVLLSVCLLSILCESLVQFEFTLGTARDSSCHSCTFFIPLSQTLQRSDWSDFCNE